MGIFLVTEYWAAPAAAARKVQLRTKRVERYSTRLSISHPPVRFREVPELYLKPQSEFEAHHELQLPRQTGAGVRRRGIVVVVVEVHRRADDSKVAGSRQIRWT